MLARTVAQDLPAVVRVVDDEVVGAGPAASTPSRMRRFSDGLDAARLERATREAVVEFVRLAYEVYGGRSR